jgi:hypothetical protein
LIVAALTTLFGLWESGADIAGMGSPRAVAAAVLVLGLTACAIGARNDAFTDRAGTQAMPPITRVLSVLGASAFAVGAAAIAIGSEALLTVLVVLTLVLWLSTTIRHLAVPVPDPMPEPMPDPVPVPRPASSRRADFEDERHAHVAGSAR